MVEHFPLLTRLFKVCPKTHRIVGLRSPIGSPWLLLPITGFLALVWFVVRVAPKPSRAAYPCQRLAAPWQAASCCVGQV